MSMSVDKKGGHLSNALAAKRSHVRESVVHIRSVLPEAEEFRRSDGWSLAGCFYINFVHAHLTNRALFELLGFLKRLEHAVFVFDSYRIHDLTTPFLVQALQGDPR
jgi:hypothetical protein